MIQKRKGLSEKQTKLEDKIMKKSHQDHDGFQLKFQKMQKQINLLNMNIKQILDENLFKSKIIEILNKQRNSLLNTFLYQNISKPQQGIKQSETIDKIQNQKKFKNINREIEHCSQSIKQSNQQSFVQNDEILEKNKQNYVSLQCQSKHLKQIFNPEDHPNKKQKSSKLKQKLSLLYQNIQINLQAQQPYLHQKILQRIKRQAKKYSRIKLLSQTQQLIKQNSQWINQQTNRLNSKLQQKTIEQICVANLALMKKVMTKKVSNNDFIYENYSQTNIKSYIQSTKKYPTQKIKQKFQQVLRKIEEKKIQTHLRMLQANKKQQNSKSIKQVLSDKILVKLIRDNSIESHTFQNSQMQMLQRASTLNQQLEKLIKG